MRTISHVPTDTSLAADLGALRDDVVRRGLEASAQVDRVDPLNRASALNLVHYLALRSNDLRQIQARLSPRGLSSLGRCEAHVLATLDAVMANIEPSRIGATPPPVSFEEGDSLLDANSTALLGDRPEGRRTRIMATMPSEAADDPSIIARLLERGMSIMRINGAHDNEDAWSRMLAHLETARKDQRRHCRVLMDLPGPKLRTGPLAFRRGVIHLKPTRDEVGRAIAPCRVLLLEPIGEPGRARVRELMHIWSLGMVIPGLESTNDAKHVVPVPLSTEGGTLDALRNSRVSRRALLRDARGLDRILRLEGECDLGEPTVRAWWATCQKSAYVINTSTIRFMARGLGVPGVLLEARCDGVPDEDGYLLLRPGDRLMLKRAQGIGGGSSEAGPAFVACTLPEALDFVHVGHRVMLDDGKFSCTCERVDPEGALLRIDECDPEGQKLRADKGVNLPDADVALDSLSDDDQRVLAFAAKRVDMVGLSFVQRAQDVTRVREALRAHGASQMGLVLKIETRTAFDHLAELLLAAMEAPLAGVMIARGDLAVEVGYERLAEVQEELLWVCEAAHTPVIWATQVLERLAKSGSPTRAEITDAAMSQRAECVMLNKGAFLHRAVETLDSILRRMEGHQDKKSAMLRPLSIAKRFWTETS